MSLTASLDTASTCLPPCARAAVHRPSSSSSTPLGAAVTALLPSRTAVGLAFDRLGEAQRRVRLEAAIGTLQWRYEGHHRPPQPAAAWSVAWANGDGQVALTLAPGPGAWAVAQSYFDRAPPALAWSLVAQVFEPWWAERTDGPWVASAPGTERYLPGGARGFAQVASRALSFEFDLRFTHLKAARAIACPPDGSQFAPGGEIGFHLACEIRLARLHVPAERVGRLCTGDFLLAGPLAVAPNVRHGPRRSDAAASFGGDAREGHASPAFDGDGVTAWLCAGPGSTSVALLARRPGAWQVTGLSGSTTLEQRMMDNQSLELDADTDTDADAHATRGVSLGTLEVPVDIVASRLTMKVAELQALRIGDVITLDQQVDEARVEVRIAGRHCARGALVAFEGRLAVQLTEIDSPAGASAHG